MVRVTTKIMATMLQVQAHLLAKMPRAQTQVLATMLRVNVQFLAPMPHVQAQVLVNDASSTSSGSGDDVSSQNSESGCFVTLQLPPPPLYIV